MCIEYKGVSLAFKFLILLVGASSLLLILGAFDGVFNFAVLNCFTVLVCLLCVVYYAVSIILLLGNKASADAMWCPMLKGMSVTALTVTVLVSRFVLGAHVSLNSPEGIAHLLLDYVLPVLVILDWILFDKKGQMTLYSPILWLIGPFIYIVYVMVAVQFGANLGAGARYPYPFLNVDELGWPAVIFQIFVLMAAFIALGYIYYGIDKYLCGLSAGADTDNED